MRIITFILTAWLLTAGASATAGSLNIVGGAITLTQAGGRSLSGEQLIGLEIDLTSPGGALMTVRIDGVEHDAQDPQLMFYHFTTRDPGSGQWQPVCLPDYEGKTMGFLLEAITTPTGTYLPAKGVYSLQCSSGASGKCVRWGYKPWAFGPSGKSLWDHHQACTRMARADYCGNGVSHTKDGTMINMYDPLGIQRSETSPAFSFEAAWGAQGAVCVRKVRWPDISSLERLAARCPQLRDKLGEGWGASTAKAFGRALIWNESKSLAPERDQP